MVDNKYYYANCFYFQRHVNVKYTFLCYHQGLSSKMSIKVLSKHVILASFVFLENIF